MSSSVPAAPERSFGERVIGALRLDATVYEEVEHDPGAMGQAAGVIAAAALAEGLGAVHAGAQGIFGGIAAGVVGWLLSTGVVWAIGVKALGHASDYPELLRTLGFASAPKLLLVLGLLPIGPLHPLLWLAVTGLTLAAYVIAVRQALDVGTGRAVLVCLLAVAAMTALGLVCGGVFAAA